MDDKLELLIQAFNELKDIGSNCHDLKTVEDAKAFVQRFQQWTVKYSSVFEQTPEIDRITLERIIHLHTILKHLVEAFEEQPSLN